MVARYPQLRFASRLPGLSPEQQARRYGPELWQQDPDLCCQLRKVEPMAAALVEADVWITSIMRSQSAERAAADLVEWDWKYQVVKVNPLAFWDRQRVWEYVKENDVPYNELHERGYPTIGCTHCTRPVLGARPEEYTRLGRWSGRQKTECGLHFSGK
jgi:phosphoadenosine phosphosulfate reductase